MPKTAKKSLPAAGKPTHILIGGQRFSFVEHPLIVNDKWLLTFERSASGRLLTSLRVKQKGLVLATLYRNKVDFVHTSLRLIESRNRIIVFNPLTRGVILDFQIMPESDVEQSISFSASLCDGTPLVMHPDRVCYANSTVGSVRNATLVGNGENIGVVSGKTEEQVRNQGGAFAIFPGLQLMGFAFEKFAVGIRIIGENY